MKLSTSRACTNKINMNIIVVEACGYVIVCVFNILQTSENEKDLKNEIIWIDHGGKFEIKTFEKIW